MDKWGFSEMTVVLAVRCGYLADDAVELLCLKRGEKSQYRLFLSTVDLDGRERFDDLDAVEFDSIDASEVESFLVESLWRLHLSPSELRLVCTSFERITSGIIEPVATEANDTTYASILLILIERQLAAVRGSPLESFMLTLVERVATAIEPLPYLSDVDKARLTVFRRWAVIEINPN